MVLAQGTDRQTARLTHSSSVVSMARCAPWPLHQSLASGQDNEVLLNSTIISSRMAVAVRPGNNQRLNLETPET
ncbi:hypothetical protein EYF80_057098 [Liparis tanakae]|uniref:Uncharacterized protein n=1 Tax=Liparis tanakae TaxID=230148 RepID=A0A4Z2EV75_9TELE|nr:hypothetical protein EYF80_057098 [Liparis tanakae]